MVKELFTTRIYQAPLLGAASLNRRLLEDIRNLSSNDRLGKRWSKDHYHSGYTSYASLSDLHHRTPAFLRLAELLAPHAGAFARAQSWEMRGLKLEMTACWVNVMRAGAHHTLHLHPHSVISGVYYVAVPKGSVALRLEDPRMIYYMNAPIGRPLYHETTPKAGTCVLFDSWLRHEVPPNRSRAPRISISFNYSLS